MPRLATHFSKKLANISDMFLKLKLICIFYYCVYVLQIHSSLAIALDLDPKYGEGPTYAQAMPQF
jgi:hypothetical protein